MAKFFKTTSGKLIKLSEQEMEKAVRAEVGTTATWGDGKQYKKVSENKWEPVGDHSSGHSHKSTPHPAEGGDAKTPSQLHEKFRIALEDMSKEHRALFRGGKMDFEKKTFTSPDGRFSLHYDKGKISMGHNAKLAKADFDDILELAYAGKEDGYDELQLVIGMQVEMANTDSFDKAMNIAVDRLDQNPTYYTDLLEAGLVDEDIDIQLSIEDLLGNREMMKARVVKYIKRVPKPSGKGFYYFYNQTDYARYAKTGKLPGDKSKKSILSGILSFFGFKKESEAHEKAKELYAEHKKDLAGVSLETFTDYLNEYLSNKSEWDKKLSTSAADKKEGKKSGGKKKIKSGSEKKVIDSGSKRYNAGIMKKIAGWVNSNKIKNVNTVQVSGRVHRQDKEPEKKTESVKVSEDFRNSVLNRDKKFRYQMLGRLQQDSDYFFQNPSPKHLWSGNATEHADNMEALYDSFSKEERPEWLTEKQLKDYVEKLRSMGNDKKEDIKKDVKDYNVEADKLSESTGIKFHYDEEIGKGVRGIRGKIDGQSIELEDAGDGKYRLRVNGNTVKENDSYEDKVFTPEQIKKHFADKAELEKSKGFKEIDKKDFPEKFTKSYKEYMGKTDVREDFARKDIKAGFEMFGEKFFILKDGKFGYKTYESKTGKHIGRGSTSVKGAVEEGRAAIEKYGKEKLKIAIEKGKPESSEAVKNESSDIEKMASAQKYLKMMDENYQSQIAEARKRGVSEEKIKEALDRNKNQSIQYLQKLKSKIENKDYDELTSVLHADNKSSRAFFEELTGVSLGKTDKSMREAVKGYVGADKMKESEAKEQKRKEDLARKEQEIKDQKKKEADDRVGKTNHSAKLYVDTDKVKSLTAFQRGRVMQQLESRVSYNGKTSTLREMLEGGDFTGVKAVSRKGKTVYVAHTSDGSHVDIPKIVHDIMVSNPNNKKEDPKKTEPEKKDAENKTPQKRVSDMTFDEYADAAWNDDPSVSKYSNHVTEKETKKRLEEAKQLLDDFNSGRKSARDILGKGNYDKKAAKEYILRKIAKEQEAIDSKGKSISFMKQYYEHAKGKEKSQGGSESKSETKQNGSAQKKYDDAKKTISQYEENYEHSNDDIDSDLQDVNYVIQDYSEEPNPTQYKMYNDAVKRKKEIEEYVKAKKDLSSLKEAAIDESGQSKLFKARFELKDELCKAGGAERANHKYYKRIPSPSGKGFIYFYSEAEVKEFKKTGKIPSQPKKEKGENKKTLDGDKKKTIKTALKKMADILSEILAGHDPVKPASGAVEKTGDAMVEARRKHKEEERRQKENKK